MSKIQSIRLAQDWLSNPSDLVIYSVSKPYKTAHEVKILTAIDGHGNILLDAFIESGTASAKKLELNERAWPDVFEEFENIIKGKKLVAYGAEFFMNLFKNSNVKHGLEFDRTHALYQTKCLMDVYAKFYGARNNYYKKIHWQKLRYAKAQCEVEVPADIESNLRNALIALGVVQKMASTEVESGLGL